MIRLIMMIEHLTLKFNRFLSSSRALFIGLIVIALWAISSSYKAPWHSSVVEIIGIISFLNIFIVQRAQNKDIKAVHLKLDELLASSNRASNLLIKAEEVPEHILEQIQGVYQNIAKTATEDESRQSVSSSAIDQIMENARGELTDITIIESIRH